MFHLIIPSGHSTELLCWYPSEQDEYVCAYATIHNPAQLLRLAPNRIVMYIRLDTHPHQLANMLPSAVLAKALQDTDVGEQVLYPATCFEIVNCWVGQDCNQNHGKLLWYLQVASILFSGAEFGKRSSS